MSHKQVPNLMDWDS